MKRTIISEPMLRQVLAQLHQEGEIVLDGEDLANHGFIINLKTTKNVKTQVMKLFFIIRKKLVSHSDREYIHQLLREGVNTSLMFQFNKRENGTKNCDQVIECYELIRELIDVFLLWDGSASDIRKRVFRAKSSPNAGLEAIQASKLAKSF